jgi:eukaryotic-like serine/threonine-protein kinase
MNLRAVSGSAIGPVVRVGYGRRRLPEARSLRPRARATMAVQNKSNVPIGTVLEGKFRITREIGRGGMAAVYEAENIDIGKRVAVKVLAAELITSRVVRERFIREARAASAVRSPHICDVYDSGMFEERPFLVMELLEGESLYDMLTRLRRLDIPTVLAVATQTSRGLGKAHEANIVHRDLKPENIFVSKDEDGGLIVKLLDFGLAKFYEPTNDGDPKTVRLTREGALFGTPAYMSPEQAKGQGEVDHRSDLWALGCIVYECLTGQTVWSVEQGVAMILAQVASAPLPRPSRIRPDLPLTFDGWFQKALDRDTAKRFQSARELSDTLGEALVPSEDDTLEVGGRGREPSIHTETEAVHIDELMASSQARSAESVRPPPELGQVPDSGDGVTPEPVVTSEPRTSGLPALFLAAAVVLGGYAIWLTVLHPPGELEHTPQVRASRPLPSASAARTETKVRVQRDPDTEPFAQLMREGQALFAKQPAQALDKMKAAMALGSASPARSLLSHASVAVEEATKGGCKVAAIARPRPYTIEQQASAPALLRTSEGVLLAWVDTHADAKRRQGHVVLLDDALRRSSDPIAITPEAANVQGLELYPMGDKVLLVYYDDGGKLPGLYSRELGMDGRITSPARRISRIRPLDHRVVLTPATEGVRYAVWVEQLDAGITDVMAAKLSSGMDALEEPRRLTTFPPIKGLAERAQNLSATVVRGELQSVFAVEQPGVRSEVFLLTTPLSMLAGPKPPDPPKGKKPATPFVGTIRSVAKVVIGRMPEPRVGCESEGCLVTWDEEKGGAFIAFLEHGRAQPLWHRQFAEKGARPVLGGDASGLALAWYEESRLKLAPVGRDGVGKPSLVNRVNGLQPHAEVARGTKAGEWLIAWRDYEAGHLELFALRAECP